MNWLTAIVEGLATALLNWARRRAETPGAMRDAKTPDQIRRDVDTDLERRLRDKERDSGKRP